MLQMLTDTQAGYRLRDGWTWSVSQPELTNDSWVSSCCYIEFHVQTIRPATEKAQWSNVIRRQRGTVSWCCRLTEPWNPI